MRRYSLLESVLCSVCHLLSGNIQTDKQTKIPFVLCITIYHLNTASQYQFNRNRSIYILDAFENHTFGNLLIPSYTVIPWYRPNLICIYAQRYLNYIRLQKQFFTLTETSKHIIPSLWTCCHPHPQTWPAEPKFFFSWCIWCLLYWFVTLWPGISSLFLFAGHRDVAR